MTINVSVKLEGKKDDGTRPASADVSLSIDITDEVETLRKALENGATPENAQSVFQCHILMAVQRNVRAFMGTLDLTSVVDLVQKEVP